MNSPVTTSQDQIKDSDNIVEILVDRGHLKTSTLGASTSINYRGILGRCKMSNLSVLTTPKTGVPKEEFSTVPGIEADSRFNNFLAWEQVSRDAVGFKKIYADITGDLIAGLLLSQIIYWHLPNSEGESKLRVKKGKYYCIAKARHEWWTETRISFKQVRRAMNILRERGVIKTEIFRFQGHPRTHIFLQQKTLVDLINKEIENPKKNPFDGKGTIQ